MRNVRQALVAGQEHECVHLGHPEADMRAAADEQDAIVDAIILGELDGMLEKPAAADQHEARVGMPLEITSRERRPRSAAACRYRTGTRRQRLGAPSSSVQLVPPRLDSPRNPSPVISTPL